MSKNNNVFLKSITHQCIAAFTTSLHSLSNTVTDN